MQKMKIKSLKSFWKKKTALFNTRMSRNSILFTFLLCIFFLSFLPESLSAQTDYTSVQSQVNQMIAHNPANQAVWGVSLRDKSGAEVISHQSRTMMRTASNSKLFVSASLLDILGPDKRFETIIYGDGELIDSTFYGSLFIVGSGDPSIDGYFFGDDPLYVFNALINQLKDLGITQIQGDLHGNESLFDDIRYPRGWEWDDLSYYYASEISALSFNRNNVDLTVRASGRPGDQPTISWFPFNTDYVTFVNEQIITPANVRFNESYARILGTNTILLRSTLPVGMLETESLSISEPALFFIDTFRKQAEKRGLSWKGELIVENYARKWSEFKILASHTSPPLSQLIRRINANSDNFYTEMLVKALAAYHLNITGTTVAGLEIISNWLEANGINASQFNFRDGSGMASANLSNASTVSQLLHLMRNHRHYEPFRNSLAVPGEDGTLRNRFLTSPIMEAKSGKTGFIAGVRTLSGYITTRSGSTYSFSILTNNFTNRVSVIDNVHQSVLELIYNEL